MPFSQGSRSGLAYVVESAFGTTPATPSLIDIPYNTHSLNLTKDRVEGNQLQPDRMPRVDRHGNRQTGGDITVDLRKGDFDPFLESAMFGSWSNDELKTGTTPKYFTIEDRALDLPQYRLFTGLSVSSLAVSIQPNQMVTGTFSMIGKDMTISGSSADATTTAASSNAPFDSYSGDIKIADAGGALGSGLTLITGIDFTIDNSLNPTFVVGETSTPQLEYGMANITGSITAYFQDATLINRFINETETAIEVSVDDPTGSNPYTFLFPRAKINSADVPVDGPTSRIVTMEFVALYDSTEASNLTITRTS
jgi:hypothetical protein